MLSALSLSASAFAPPAGVVPSLSSARAAPVSMAISKPSNAMPFLTAPASQASGLLGAEAGFDPLYLSDFLDIKFLREAELKHGRICMLAVTGFIVQEFASLPGYPGYTPNPVEAFSSVPAEGLGQIFLFIVWLETYYFNKGKWTMMDMFDDPARKPGDLGFDPLQFGKNPATREKLETQELTHARLAMIAFAGMIHQVFVTGKPVFASLGDIFAPP